ncbi:MAG: primosomal protein N' [Sulfuricella sp.]|nr:primosomal protein N' [Sulfuricella sp.]
MYLRVALDVPLNTLFDYAWDGGEVSPGSRVLVPFGRRNAVGVVVSSSENTDVAPERIKAVTRLFRETPVIPPDILRLLQFCSDYYQHPLGETIFNALPTALRQTKPLNLPKAEFFRLSDAGRTVDPANLPGRAVVKRRLLLALREAGQLSRDEIAALSPSAKTALKEFQGLGWAEEAEISSLAPRAARAIAAPATPHLNDAQHQAVTAIHAGLGVFGVSLLHGVTGSGKTEVYLQAVEAVLLRGAQVLVLVPEINLTPQLEQRFRARFPAAHLVSLHSNLAGGERLRNYLDAQSGQADIVLGTRLSVFAPLPRLALIIVDEEHDASFKQQDGLRYSARDVAVIRAKQANVPIVLGSATPALETWHNAQSGRYTLLSLPERAVSGAKAPDIHFIDTTRLKLEDGLSEPLLAALRERLARGEQSLVFINRRGYAPVLMCGQCAWISACHRCSGRLVAHLRERRLRCHHCGHETRIPPACPSCGNPDLVLLGHGTQRIEEALELHLPTARILRVDRDSARRKDALPALLKQIHDGEVDIVVGTQILAKGHDFKKLTLVGVVNADGALYSADFRAAERLFAQLMQVAGRAGRAELPGEVLIQTQFRSHPLFAALQRHDYPAFADDQLAERRQVGFPPYCYQALLRAEAAHLESALKFLREAAKLGEALDNPVEIYDPTPAQMARIAGKERAHLLVQSASRANLHAFLKVWRTALEAREGRSVRWSLDVDPLEF